MVSMLFFLAYIIGSIPFGPLFAWAKGIDLKNIGSGNIGATNVFRAMGPIVGITVMLLDILKGIVPVLIAYSFNLSYWEITMVGIFAVIGHLFPIFLKFKGGKGVATATGVFLLMNPGGLAIAVVVFILVVMVSKYVSLASMLAASTIFILQITKGQPWSYGEAHITTLSLLVLCVVVYMHRKNILRLWNGTENKIF